MDLVEKNARKMYADDVRLTVDDNLDCAFYVRVKGQIRQVEFDQLPLMMRNVYYAAASAAVVDCSSSGRRQRMGLETRTGSLQK